MYEYYREKLHVNHLELGVEGLLYILNFCSTFKGENFVVLNVYVG